MCLWSLTKADFNLLKFPKLLTSMHSWWHSLSDNGEVIASNWEEKMHSQSPGWWAFNSSLTASALSSQSPGLGCNQSHGGEYPRTPAMCRTSQLGDGTSPECGNTRWMWPGDKNSATNILKTFLHYLLFAFYRRHNSIHYKSNLTKRKCLNAKPLGTGAGSLCSGGRVSSYTCLELPSLGSLACKVGPTNVTGATGSSPGNQPSLRGLPGLATRL